MADQTSRWIDAAEVAGHKTAESCWLALYGHVYDLTDFLSAHPAGPTAILALAGTDATAVYDPIHPPGTLEDHIPLKARLGRYRPSPPAAAAPSTPPIPTPSTLPSATALAAGANANAAAAAVPDPPALSSLLSLDELERAAESRLPARVWAYYSSASDDERTLNLNRAAYAKVLLRPRFLTDTTHCSTATRLLASALPVSTPLFLAPAAVARLAHPDGERAAAQAAARFGAALVLSNNSSMRPEDVVRGASVHQVFGWQLYVQTDRAVSEAMLRRINALSAHFRFIVLTVDATTPGKREADERLQTAALAPVVASAHAPAPTPAAAGIGNQLAQGTARDLEWEPTLAWLAAHTHLPIVIKGLLCHEDVIRASHFAPRVRAVILSNHGGRALDTTTSALHALRELRRHCPEVMRRLEVWIDGGVRRGTDIVKALCLGATAVGIGRAPLYGLAVGGQAGVERTLEILQSEIESCMRLLGVTKVDELGVRHVNTRLLDREIYEGEADQDGSSYMSKL